MMAWKLMEGNPCTSIFKTDQTRFVMVGERVKCPSDIDIQGMERVTIH